MKRLLMIIGILIIITTGCQQKVKVTASKTDPGKAVEQLLSGSSIDSFLKTANLKIQGNAERFKVKVPEKWNVISGEYPEGLYWSLANVFSKDASLDLTRLKGKTVDVWRYSLADGLPGQKEQSNFRYPPKAVLLVENEKVVGAWLSFNTAMIGPSIKRHYLEDITGLTFRAWLEKEGLFTSKEKNRDLTMLQPVEVLKEFFKAINNGNKERAYACLDPSEMLNSLTMNLSGEQLYHPKFGESNSFVENIIKAEPVDFKLMDSNDFTKVESIGNRTEVEVAISMNIKWRDNAFNTPGQNQIRFTIMKKYKDGWKLQGLGTGP